MGWKYSTPAVEHAYAQTSPKKALDTFYFKNTVHVQPTSQDAVIRNGKLYYPVPGF